MLLTKQVQNSDFTALDELRAIAVERKHRSLLYAGDVTPQEAYSFLQENEALLLDVRTLPEWQFIGTPDMSSTKSQFATISWKTYPTFAANPQFLQMLAAIKNISKETPIFMICRSGGRSLDAAVAATDAGYRYCFNVIGGFEGEPDSEGHRGTEQGWKAANLPWKQG
jgi:rhodanese-related sulfurtransferase